MNADNVTIDRLHVTGALYGIYASGSSDSDGVTISNSTVFNNLDTGILLDAGNDAARISGNVVYGNRVQAGSNDYRNGIQAGGNDSIVTGNTAYDWYGSGILVGGLRTLVEGNTAYNAGYGIAADAGGPGGDRIIIRGNTVLNNSGTGIHGNTNVLVVGNTVSGNGNGISSSSGEVAGNLVFFNGVGIVAGGTVRDNRIWNNTTGIQGGGQVSGNLVYANTVGLSYEYAGNSGDVINNLFYANSQAAVRITQGSSLRIVNNTLYQPTGNAIEVSQASYDIELRNNVLWADSGVALSVAADSQFGFRSDYNLLAPTAGETLGRWQDRDFADRAEWYWETGQDGHSLQADPQFVNPAGPNGLLGFSRAAIGPAVIIDNADAGFSTTGSWGTGSGGYSENYRTHGVGDGSATATWTFSGLVPGTGTKWRPPGS